jgi:hypothetical protein
LPQRNSTKWRTLCVPPCCSPMKTNRSSRKQWPACRSGSASAGPRRGPVFSRWRI